MSTALRKSFTVAKIDDELGVVFGWAIVCTKSGEDYFDLQGDHIPESVMAKAVTDFMQNSRVAKEMHAGDARGEVVHSMIVTKETTKPGGIEADQTGWYVGVKPDAELLAKFKAGDVAEFSIGGTAELETAEKATTIRVGKAAGEKSERRIITVLNLDELSLVDKGAQEPGYSPIAKRDPKAIAKRGRLTGAAEGHTHLCDDGVDAGFTSYDSSLGGHSHPYTVTDGVVEIGLAANHTHEAPTAKRAPAPAPVSTTKNAPTPEKTMDPKILKAIASLTADQLEHLKGLPADEQEAFLSKSSTDRAAIVKAAIEADPMVTIAGQSFRKSQDPGGHREAALREVEASRAALKQATDANLDALVEKRASTVLKNFGGEAKTRNALMKAVEGIADEATRTAVLAELTKADAALGMTQKSIGFGGGKSPSEGSAEAELQKMAEDEAKNHGGDVVKARQHLIDTNDKALALSKRAKADREASRAN